MKEYPLIKYVILFITGIILQKFIVINPLYLVILLIIPLTLFFPFKKYLNKSSIITLYSVLIYIALISTGLLNANLSQPDYNFIPGDIYKIKDITFYAKVEKVNLLKKEKLQFEISTDSLGRSNTVFPARLKFLVKVDDKDENLTKLYNSIAPGNYISIKGTYRKAAEQRNPGEFDYNKYLRAKGISGIIYSYHSTDVKILNKDKLFFPDIIFQARKFVDEKLNTIYNDQSAGLLRGLILADRSEITYETRTDFINSGVVHVLAVSGLHVGFIAFIFLILFGRLNIYLRLILTSVGILCFMFLTGIPASVFRATVMAIVIIVTQLSNRSTNLFNSLALAALIILLISPGDLFNPGFQLSFSAVLSIAVIYPIFQKRIQNKKILNKPVSYLALFFAVTLSAQLGTLPLTMYYFGKASIIAIVANLLVIPMIGIIISIGIVTIVFGSFSLTFTHYFAVSNEILIWLLFKITHFTGNLSFSFLKVNQFNQYDIFIFYFFLIFAIVFFNKFHKLSAKIILITLTILNIYLFANLNKKELLPDGELSVLMIDVGQGDAILIKFPQGTTALIDAGDASQYFDNGNRVIAPLLNYLDIPKIDYGFVTHLDNDHVGGFYSLIKLNLIKHIYKQAVDTTLPNDKKFEKYLKANNLHVTYYNKNLIKIDNTSLYILNNLNDSKRLKFSNNNSSGVFKVEYGKNKLLFTGDIEKPAEKYFIAKYGGFLNVDVLKVAHHGSETSSSQAFLENTSPNEGLISVGIDNRFNHPSEEVIKRLKENNVKVIRTDKRGAILICSNSDSIYSIDWRNR